MKAGAIFTEGLEALRTAHEDDMLDWEATLSYLAQAVSDFEKLEPCWSVVVRWIGPEGHYDNDIWYVPVAKFPTEDKAEEEGRRLYRKYMIEDVDVTEEELDAAEKYAVYSIDYIMTLGQVIIVKQKEEAHG